MRLKALFPVAFALLLPLTAVAEVVPLDRIVAVVNDDAIMQSQLDQRIEQVRSQAQGRMQLPDNTVLQRQVLDRMIVEQIELQMAERAQLTIDETHLNNAMRNIAEGNNMTLQQFADSLEQNGQSLAQVRSQVREELLIRQVQQSQVASKVRVSDSEVDRLMEQASQQNNASYHLAQILVAVPQAPTPDQVTKAKAKAQAIYAKLQEGADFQQTAVASSDDAQALQGGDLGWRPAAQMPSIFADVVPAMNKGDISQPIRSASGFHIVTLLDKRGGSGQASREQVSQAIFSRKVNDELEAWVQEIRANAYIDNRLDQASQ